MKKSRIRVKLPKQKIEDFCRRHRIRKLAVFGSALRKDFGPKSDLDVLVEFEAEYTPGLIGLAGLEIELSKLLGGRKVDMNTPLCLSPFFRDDVLAEAEPVYVAG